MKKLVCLILLLAVVSIAHAQPRVFPYRAFEISCSEVPGEVVDEGDVVHVRGEKHTGVYFSDVEWLNGCASWTIDSDYFPATDISTFVGTTTLSSNCLDGTFFIYESGYWNAQEMMSSASGYGTSLLAGADWRGSSKSISLDAALAMIGKDSRVVNGNPCYPEALPAHGKARLIFGQIVFPEE